MAMKRRVVTGLATAGIVSVSTLAFAAG